MKHAIALLAALTCATVVTDVQAGIYDTMADREYGLFQLALLEVGRDNDQALIDVDKQGRAFKKEARKAIRYGLSKNKSCLRIKKDWLDEENRLYNAEPDIKAIFDEADHEKVVRHAAAYIAYDCMRVKGK